MCVKYMVVYVTHGCVEMLSVTDDANVYLLKYAFFNHYLLQKKQGRDNIEVLEHERQTIQHQDTIKHVSVFPQQSHPYV